MRPTNPNFLEVGKVEYIVDKYLKGSLARITTEYLQKYLIEYSLCALYNILRVLSSGGLAFSPSIVLLGCPIKSTLYSRKFDLIEAYRIKNAHLFKAEDFDKQNEFSPLDYSDLYFFDPMNNWTYIKPHEDYCGPYYFKVE